MIIVDTLYAAEPGIIEFDLDSDELDEASLQHESLSRTRGRGDMPRMLGLVHSSRGSTDIPLQYVNDLPSNRADDHDLASLILKIKGGSGGMLESIANMANSILGAGIIGRSLCLACSLVLRF